MNKALRKAVIAGNWKMNKTARRGHRADFRDQSPGEGRRLRRHHLHPFYRPAGRPGGRCRHQHRRRRAELPLGEDPAPTPAKSRADMLAELGVEYVIIGHSERRQYFAETDDTVNKRAGAALAAGLTVILCVGETLEQREQGVTSELVALQTKIALGDVSAEELKNVIIAYEPVWAIGTGQTATAEQADEVCHTIREVVASLYGKAAADGIHHPVRRLHERRQRRRAAGPARCGRRPDRRRLPQGRRLRRHRQAATEVSGARAGADAARL